jgi:hypothetical protein
MAFENMLDVEGGIQAGETGYGAQKRVEEVS